MEFLLLGNVEARRDGAVVDLGPARQRCVLVALLADVNQVVSVDRLVDRVWGERAPLRARETLRSYIFRLRRAGVEITRRSGGYQLSADATAVDLHRFSALLRGGDQASALDLWRGEPFAGLDSPWLDDLRSALESERFAARLDHHDARLGRGEHGDLVAELTELTTTHPVDERLAGQLMVALYRSGRASEALEHFRRTRARLDELGVHPGPALHELHQRMLTNDRALAAPTQSPVPRQLPAPPRPFTARTHELAALDKVFANGSTLVTVVVGPGGIGKTWLTLHWAHAAADRFPDGQLYVNLRGFDPTGTPTPPAAALRGFLDALGVTRLPVDADALAGLYRSRTAGKRLLIVLDNAFDTEQVRSLLPGSSTCGVVVTSRRRLTGLVTAHGAHLLPLDVIDDVTARELLASHLGHERLATEPDAVAEIVASCGGLPLAIGIVAARAAGYPTLPLRTLADDLRDARLAALDAGEPSADIGAAFAASHRALSAATATVFELLAMAPGPDIGVPAATALTTSGKTSDVLRHQSVSRETSDVLPVGRSVDAALRELVDAHLLGQPVPGRYRMHDLVRLHAATLGERQPSAPAALRRLVDHYLHTAHAGERVLEPHRPAITLPAGPPAPVPDEATALAWFDQEHANLLAAQRLAAARGWSPLVWQLAWTLLSYHARRGLLHDRLTVWRLALDATADDRAARALAHKHLGYACAEAGQGADALAHLGHALDLADDVRDRGSIHHALARAWEQQGDLDQALQHAENARALYEAAGDATGHARLLPGLGWLLAQLGRYAEATARCEAGLVLLREHGSKAGQASCLDNLGYFAHLGGRHTEAVEYYRQALPLYDEAGDDYFSANTLDHLGESYAALDLPGKARDAWQQALHRYRAQDRATEAERVERLLAELRQ